MGARARACTRIQTGNTTPDVQTHMEQHHATALAELQQIVMESPPPATA